VVLKLRRGQLAQQVVLVVDRREGQVELRGPVGRATAGRRSDQLESLDDLPPELVEVLFRVAVELALEVHHDQAPAYEHEHREPLMLGEKGQERVERRGVGLRNGPQPARVGREASEQHRDRLGRRDVCRLDESPRQVDVEVLVVHRVAELVEHRRGPSLVRNDVAENADVLRLAIDLRAERVLTLLLALVEVTALEDVLDRKTANAKRALGQQLDVGRREELIQIEFSARRGFLEKRVGVVPRHQLLDRDPEP